jgi:hypothetical protein
LTATWRRLVTLELAAEIAREVVITKGWIEVNARLNAINPPGVGTIVGFGPGSPDK